MSALDSLLSLLVSHGGDELRLATGEPPRMFARGVPLRLTLPATPPETLDLLVQPLLEGDDERRLADHGAVQRGYTSSRGETFVVTIRRREAKPDEKGALQVVVIKGARPATASIPRAASTSAPPPTTTTPSTSTSTLTSTSAPPTTSVAPPPPQPSFAPAHAHHEPSSTATHPLLATLLDRARADRASDLHLADGAPPSARIDGALRPIERIAIDDLRALLEPSLDASARAALAEGRSLDESLRIDGARYRLHAYRAAEGLAAAIRLLPGEAPLLSELDLPVPLDELALLPHGLVLVCGPAGSGKTHTLAALAREVLRRRAALVLTLEDPIELALPTEGTRGLARQRQVGRDVPDFASGLRDALRADPDVLLVGELRDSATVALALTAAETGHLVLATVHAASAAGAIDRLVDASAPRRESEVRAQLSMSLRAVVSQRLLPRARSGGRVVALEVLRVNHAVAALVREGRTAQIASAIQSGRKDGMMQLEACLADLVKSGAIAKAHAEQAANDPSVLASYLAPGR